MMKSDYLRVCADVDLSAIRTNIINIKKRLKPETKICCVIKADGYGHGAVPIAKHTSDLARFYAVATLSEALALRENGVTAPILVLGYVFPDGYETAVENDIRLTVFDMETASFIALAAEKCRKKAKIHIKLDTGMSRIGFFTDDKSLDVIKEISKFNSIEIEGIFTHLFASDSADKTSAYVQVEKFLYFTGLLEESSVYIPVKHCSNSAAAISMPGANMDMVRLGIALYGLYPSDDVHEQSLKSALSLKSHVIMVKRLPKGSSIGYGAAYTAKRDMDIATIPVGYADGYFRSLSNKGYVLINGMKAPVTGRICMDQFMVDVSHIPGAVRGSEVVLIGSSGNETITVEEISALAGSFNYEFVCDIGKRVPRRYFLDGKQIETE